ncbi:hypothetical protein HDU91_004116 [Kappamyces sp. JEL0680]|nr:hypothetical protein HDU91_004116 [Kappamyces sp. JEL0680]
MTLIEDLAVVLASASRSRLVSTKRMKCYYDILGLERDCSDADIKKAYRRMALAHHPDKQRDNVEEATRQFALIQEAHEVLSDPHERAWYNQHREQILRGPLDASTRGQSLDFMATDELLAFHSRSCFSSFSRIDGKTDFYSVYRALFIKIELEEKKALEIDGESLLDMAVDEQWSFGESSLEYGDQLRGFYNRFTSFSSCKSFRWFDEYNPLDYPDRERRRLAEKKNKKLREAARKEFSTAVRELAIYVKKRDPRVKHWLEEQERRSQQHQEVQREKEAREKQEKLSAISNYVAADWTLLEDDGGDLMDPDGILLEEFACIVCYKAFRSQSKLDAHCNTQRHLEIVEALRQELEQEDLELSLSGTVLDDAPAAEPETVSYECEVCVKSFATKDQLAAHEQNKKHRAALKAAKQKPVARPPESEPGNGISSQPVPADDAALDNSSGGKKKRRAAKETAAHAAFSCNVCKEGFASKTKLFNHINETGHARAK